MAEVRSYRQEVVSRLIKLASDTRFRFSILGLANGCSESLFSVTFGHDASRRSRRVLLSAGIHGEEPAGVYALLAFLERDIHRFANDFEFLIFPCINPFGFERNYRFNYRGRDINREFKDDVCCVESWLVMAELKRRGWSFVCTVDLHETDPNFVGEGFTQWDSPHDFYMWEVCPDKHARIGDKVIDVVRRVAPICIWDTIYQDKNSGGVIWYPEGCVNPVYLEGTTLEGFVSRNYTSQAFTLETPCGWPMWQRTLAHRVALHTILELKRNA
ncbi:MAG: M14 family metallocarboxypeptidase [Patescibacteria group bacterium]